MNPQLSKSNKIVLRSFIAILLFLSLHIIGNAQTHSQDSLTLINVLKTNCQECALKDSTSSYFWNLEKPVDEWPGIQVWEGRVIGIILSKRGLTGDLTNLSQCTELEQLTLSHNNLVSLPPLDSFPRLYLLECDHNKLTDLPEIDQCFNLQGLICSYNHLTNLPSFEGNPNLGSVVCDHNQLHELPPLEQCPDLVWLDCGYNQIEKIPSLFYCNRLGWIDCRGNLLRGLPPISPLNSIMTYWCDENFLSEEAIMPYLSIHGFDAHSQFKPSPSSGGKQVNLSGITATDLR